MKFFILSVALLCIYTTSFAGSINRISANEIKKPTRETIANANVVSPTDVANAQRSGNLHIQRMLDTYTDGQLREYALSVNKAQIAAARLNGTTPPEKLSTEVLSNR